MTTVTAWTDVGERVAALPVPGGMLFRVVLTYPGCAAALTFVPCSPEQAAEFLAAHAGE